jgi:hypothetical protein
MLVCCWPKKGLLKSETMGIDAMLGQTPCYGRNCAATRLRSGLWLCFEAAECRAYTVLAWSSVKFQNLRYGIQTLEAKNLPNRDLENA